MEVGARIRDVRHRRHLSLQQVASQAGISAATLSRIETGKQSLDVVLFLRLAAILELPPAALLEPPMQTDAIERLRRALATLAPEQRAELWNALALERSGSSLGSEALPDRLAELLAQIELFRVELESMRSSDVPKAVHG